MAYLDIADFGEVPQSTQVEEDFEENMDAMLAKFPDMRDVLNNNFGQMETDVALVVAGVVAADASADDAADSAALAAAAVATAAAAAGAVLWVSMTAYAIDVSVISPTNRQTYRHKTASGASATDPANDSTNWTQLTGVDRGADGAAAVATVTLVATSPGAQSMTPTGYGSAFKLPDATGCSKGTGLFSLTNLSTYPIKILNNADTLLGFVPPFSTVAVNLSANATAAGVWGLPGMIPIAVTAEISSLALTLGSSTSDIQMCAVDATRTLITTGLSSGTGGVYGVVYDTSTGLFGAVTLIRATTYFNRLVKCADGVVLCVSFNTTTGMQSNVLTITGTAISIGANGTATLAGNVSAQSPELVQLIGGGGYAVTYGQGTVRELRAISVSGTSSTIGAAVSLNGSLNSGSKLYAVSSTAVLVMTFTNSATVNFRGVGIAGTVATLGVEVTAATDLTIGFRPFPWGARWGCLYSNAGAIRCALVSVTGTTPSVTTVAGTGNQTNNFQNYTGVQVSGLKAIVMHNNNDANFNINLFADDGAGTVSAGTALTAALAGSTSVIPLGVVSSVAYFLIGTTNYKMIAGYTISGASPVLAYAKSTKAASGGAPVPTNYSESTGRSANTLISGRGLFVIPQNDGPASLSNKDGVQVMPDAIAGLCGNTGQPGPAANEAWVYAHPYLAASSITIQRVECAA